MVIPWKYKYDNKRCGYRAIGEFQNYQKRAGEDSRSSEYRIKNGGKRRKPPFSGFFSKGVRCFKQAEATDVGCADKFAVTEIENVTYRNNRTKPFYAGNIATGGNIKKIIRVNSAVEDAGNHIKTPIVAVAQPDVQPACVIRIACRK